VWWSLAGTTTLDREWWVTSTKDWVVFYNHCFISFCMYNHHIILIWANLYLWVFMYYLIKTGWFVGYCFIIASRIRQNLGTHLKQPISDMLTCTSRIWVTCGVIFETTNRQHAHIPYFDNIWGQIWNNQSAIVPHTTLDSIWGHIWNDKKSATSLHPVFGSPLMSYLKRPISNKPAKSFNIQHHINFI
jgi:hypothetical protein